MGPNKIKLKIHMCLKKFHKLTESQSNMGFHAIYDQITSYMSYMHVFSVFKGDAITPNLGTHRMDTMTISYTALDHTKL
jgi:hypothetical protein